MAAYDKTDAPDDDLLTTLKGWYKQDVVKANTWRKEAAEAFKFRDGDQWSEDDKRALEASDRPVVVFNRLGVLVDAVVGSEIGNRREVRYIPREQGDNKPNEVLTSAAEWFRDQCDAEDEETAAFKDNVTAGMGWTETRLDYESNPAGEPKIDQIDPMEMVWDCNARKPNLVDTKRRWRVRKMSVEAAQKLIPYVDVDDLNAAWADETEDESEPHSNNPGERYRGDGDPEAAPSKLITIVACQYLQAETYYRAIIMSPEGQPQEAELDEAKLKIAQKANAVLKAVKQTRQRVVQCFIGRTIIKKPEPTQTGTFTWNCMTGLYDHDKGVFYGIVRRGMDPQRWANKWLSQMMHIMNSQAKGGVMAEAGAFENQLEAEANWAKPEGITLLAKGALTGANGPKLQPKPVAQFPAGFDRLMHYADEAIIKATGINMELLGMREVNQPGVLEYQRKQQGIAILASFFDGLRRYRKIQGRAMLKLIQDHLSDGRLIRVVGDERAEYVPLTKGATVEYDIIIDDSPSSTNEKEKTWALLMQVLPMFKDSIGPKEGLMLAEYSPLPTSLVEKIKGMVQERETQPDPLQQQAMELQAQEQANKKAELDLKMMVERNKARDIEVKADIEREKLGVERQKASNEELSIIAQMNEGANEGDGEQRPKGRAPILGALDGLKQSNDQMMAVLQMMAAPKELVRDPATGRTVGVRTVLQ